VVSLIDHIAVYREHRVEVAFRWDDENRRQLDLVMQARELYPEKEAV